MLSRQLSCPKRSTLAAFNYVRPRRAGVHFGCLSEHAASVRPRETNQPAPLIFRIVGVKSDDGSTVVRRQSIRTNTNQTAKYLIRGESAVLPPSDLDGIAKRSDQREPVTATTSAAFFVPVPATAAAAGDALLPHPFHPRRHEVVAVTSGEGAVVGQAPARQESVSNKIHLPCGI